jgi:ribose-phosphate pyrophosphokinase
MINIKAGWSIGGNDWQEIDHSNLTFSGGESHPRLKLGFAERFLITAHLHSANDIMELLLVTDAIRRQVGNKSISIEIPYFPYARQDRVCYHGEALSVAVMAKLINSQKYNKVTVWDPHSNVTPALIDNCEVIPAWRFVRKVATTNCVLVCPDAGAKHRVEECSYKLHLPMIECSKKRNPKDGTLTDAVVPEYNYVGKNLLIVDDICDGGRTFINLAKKLRQQGDANEIFLYVTHGIFSNGLRVFDNFIDRIFCANPWPLKDNNGMIKVSL